MSSFFDVGIGWGNPVDRAFVEGLHRELGDVGFSVHEISFSNLAESFEKIVARELSFGAFIDRGYIDNPTFFLIASHMRELGALVINDPHALSAATSKAALYTLFSKHALPLPNAFIIAATQKSDETSRKELCARMIKKLGTPFVLKLSYGGYDRDVITNAHSPDDIIQFAEDNSTEDILVQKYIVPTVINGKTAWFRIIHACGEIIPLWWDPQNHFYQVFGSTAEEKGITKKVQEIARRIATLTKIAFFSTEIAIDDRGNHYIIDYVNHPLDVNIQENTPDGLPQSVLHDIIMAITNSIQTKKHSHGAA